MSFSLPNLPFNIANKALPQYVWNFTYIMLQLLLRPLKYIGGYTDFHVPTKVPHLYPPYPVYPDYESTKKPPIFRNNRDKVVFVEIKLT